MVTVADVKLYLRMDEDIDEDDNLLERLLTAAQTFIEQATGRAYDDSEVYNLAVMNLTAHWYENRTNYSTKTKVNDLPLTINSLIRHLALASEV